NDYNTASILSFLYNQNVDEDQLALWTILKIQYPSLAEYFWSMPDKIEAIFQDDVAELTQNKEHNILLKRNDVRKLFKFQINDRLICVDEEFVKKLKFEVELKNILNKI